MPADPLQELATRAQDEPFFLASVLAVFSRAERLDDAGLAQALGCPVEDLPMLRLCRAPRADAPGFRADIDCISARFRLDPARLAAVVKRGRVIARMQRPAAGEAGFLMAARDRDDELPPKEEEP